MGTVNGIIKHNIILFFKGNPVFLFCTQVNTNFRYLTSFHSL